MDRGPDPSGFMDRVQDLDFFSDLRLFVAWQVFFLWN